MANTTLQLAFVNQTTSSTVYAYVTGQAIDNNNALFLLQSDGAYYYPSNPPADGSPLSADCAIPLGAPGSTKTITIPQIAGGRIWFSIGTPLTFLLNPGPALVEPSVTNNSDPNIEIFWDFCEFTFNSNELFANISYVDFVSIPIALSLTSSSGPVQTVTGMPENGLGLVCNGLITQTAVDEKPWSSLIIKNGSGQNLRALSPNNGRVLGTNFTGYFEPFVAEVFSRFASTSLSVNTQAAFGMISGEVTGNKFSLGGHQFAAPSTADIFSCSTGPFATGSNAEVNTIIPRLAAAFNRSTLLTTTMIPAPASDYYQDNITNHYSRIVHAANVDGLGYGFPYDDVTPDGGVNQAGVVESSTPSLFTVTVGGGQYGNVAKEIPAGPKTRTVTEPKPSPAAGAHKPGGAGGAVAGQKPLAAPPTQGEEAAKKRAEVASKGSTATPTDAPKAPGPGVPPHPKKPNLFKRILRRLRRKK